MVDYLPKSDFHVAQTCPAKLYYRKRRYPFTQDEDEHLEFPADGGYNGRTFCVSRAFFPDSEAWEKIANDLRIKSVVDAEHFTVFSGMRSLPFPAGKHTRIAVKVIDTRGNKAMRVIRLE